MVRKYEKIIIFGTKKTMFRKDYAYNILKQNIASGFYAPGSRLPSEQKLAAELQLSRNTIRSALQKLREEKLIESDSRSGSYVSLNNETQRFLFLTFDQNLDNLQLVTSYFVSELQNALSKYNHSLILFSAMRLFEIDAESFEKLLKDNDIRGIFFHSKIFKPYPSLREMIHRCHIPVVEFGNNLSSDGAYASVCVDIRQAFADGVRYLATFGYKRIATVFKRNSMRGFTRSSYEEFLNSIGLEESIPLIYDTSIIYENKIPELMASSDRPEAFMCFCDGTAIKMINALQKCNVNVPADVAVMGISGYLERLFVSPPLSIVNFHYDQMAKEAVRLMLNSSMWFMKEPALINYISHKIVQRGTTPAFVLNSK